MRLFSILAPLMVMGACAHAKGALQAPQAMPSTFVGDFVDDYGIRYSISSVEWFQRPRAKYHIEYVNAAAEYLVARNDADNPSEKGLWSRIDWVRLENMAPFEWAFCLSAYDASTREAAEAVTIAKRETPRTGCGGHPFSRMRRATPADTLEPKPYKPKPAP